MTTTKRLGISLGLVVLNAAMLSAQSLKIPASVFAGSVVFDVGTSFHAIDQGGVEQNPMLGSSKASVALVSAGLAAVVLWGSHRLMKPGTDGRPSHPRLATSLLLVSAGIHGAAGIHNLGIEPAQVGRIAVQPIPTVRPVY